MVVAGVMVDNGGMEVPSSCLLLHGLGGSGQGSVAILERRLRDLGWTGTTYLRPTLQSVHAPAEPFDGEAALGLAWNELNGVLEGRTPNLVVGFSFGGLVAAFSPAPLRLSVCSPWACLAPSTLHRLTSRNGLAVLQGMKDTVVPPAEHLAALPPVIPLDQDAEGSHDFDAWMDRIAAWVLGSWQRHPFGLLPAEGPAHRA